MSIAGADLLDLAGPGAFDRGCEYYREGRVVELETHADRTLALVDGTTLYRVELRHDKPELVGSCDCPASDNIFFCKHCVATALALRDELAASALATPKDGGEALRDYLTGLDTETLISHLMSVIHKDPALYQRLCSLAQVEKGPADAKELKEDITRATPLSGLFEPTQVRAYFRRLAATLQGIAAVADQLAATELLDIALHTFKRFDNALEHVDDSYGYRYESQELARDIHCQALKRSSWPPERQAQHLLELALNDPGDQFAGVPFDYADGIGAAGLEAFFTEVETRLAALPDLPVDASFDEKLPYLRLTHYLRARAEGREDWDELIRVDEITATTEIDFERLAASCLNAGKPDLAVVWLRKADALDPHERSRRNELWSEAHAGLGDWDAAVAAREVAFRQDVSYQSFQRLMAFAEQAERVESVRDSAIQFLRSGTRPGVWPDEIHAYALVQVLREDRNYTAMAEIAETRIWSPERLQQVAYWLSKSAPNCATPLYEKAVGEMIAKKTNSAYRSAVDALFKAKPVFDARGAGAFDECLARIRATHNRKRNLMAELDEQLGAQW